MKLPMVVLAVIVAFPFRGGTEEFNLVDLPGLPAQNPRLLPLNLAGAMAGAKIESSDPALKNEKLLSLIDPDRTSGVELSKNKEYNFVVTFDNIEKVNKMTFSGELKGSTVDIKMSKLPNSSSDSAAWEKVVENKRLDSDINTVSFKPQDGYQALVTVKTDSYQGETPPMIRDISSFGTKDVRSFALQSKSDIQTAPRDSSNLSVSKPSTSIPNVKVNVGGMSAGASIISSSLSVDPKQVDNAIDDNIATFLEVPKNSRQGALVVALGQNRTVDRVSITHSKTKGTLKAYLVKDMPGKSKTSSLGMRRFIIVVLRGELILTRKDKTTSVAKKGDIISESDILKTGKNSLCELKCEDSSIVRLGPDTSLQFNSTDRTLNVDQGSVLVSTPTSASDLTINTPSHSTQVPSGCSLILECPPREPLKVTHLPSPSSRPVLISERTASKTNFKGQSILSQLAPLSSVTISNDKSGDTTPKTQNVSIQDLVRSEPLLKPDVFQSLPPKQEKPIQTALLRPSEKFAKAGESTSSTGPIKELLAKNEKGVTPPKNIAEKTTQGTIPTQQGSQSITRFDQSISLESANFIGTMPLDQGEFSDIEIPFGMEGEFVIFIFEADGFDLPADLENYELTFKLYDISIFGEYDSEGFVLAPAPANSAFLLTRLNNGNVSDASGESGSSTSSDSSSQSESVPLDVTKIAGVIITPSEPPADASPSQ